MSHRTKLLLVLLFLCGPLEGIAQDRLLVVNKSGASVSILDLASGRAAKTIPTGDGPHEIAISPDGRTVAVANYGPAGQPGNSLTLFSADPPHQTRTLVLSPWSRPHGMAWLPDSRGLLVTSETAAKLLLVDTEADRVTAAIDTGQSLSHMVALDAQRNMAYVANIVSGSVSVIDLRQQVLRQIIQSGGGSEGVAVSPRNGEIWVSNRDDDTVSILEPDSLRIRDTLTTGAMPVRVAFSPGGDRAYVTNAKGNSLSVFDTASRELLAGVDLSGYYALGSGRWMGGGFGFNTFPIGVVASADGKKVYVSNSYGGVVLELDTEKLTIIRELTAGKEPDGLAYRPQPSGP